MSRRKELLKYVLNTDKKQIDMRRFCREFSEKTCLKMTRMAKQSQLRSEQQKYRTGQKQGSAQLQYYGLSKKMKDHIGNREYFNQQRKVTKFDGALE